MAFDGVQISSTKTPPGSIVTGWRQDLAIGDVLSLSLTSSAGVSSYRWLLVGRPEGSVAGGPGPEPILLGTGATASFTVDDDSTYPKDGTYIVHCIVNEGTPSETRITVGLARLAAVTTNDGRPLRMMGGFEVAEDTSDPLVEQGYNKMLERWMRYVVENAGGGGGGGAPVYTFTAYADQIPPHKATVSEGGIGQDLVLVAEWAVPWDTICGANANVSVQVCAIGQNSAATDPSQNSIAIPVVNGLTPGTLGPDTVSTFVRFPTDATAGAEAGTPTVIAKPTTPLLQVAVAPGLDPDDSASVSVDVWGIVVSVFGTA